MGNRAVVTFANLEDIKKFVIPKGNGEKLKGYCAEHPNKVSVYLHWNGGRSSIEGFCEACRRMKFRGPASDSYGVARFVQVVANLFGGDGLSIGVDTLGRSDCDNYDNGDEVEVITNGDISYEEVWGNDYSKHEFSTHGNDFDYSGKWLVNHDKKLSMSFDKYIAESKTKYGTIAPFPLLTAIGNNRGGGDYYEDNSCYDEVGTWAWNRISIEDARPDGYEEFSVVFKEQ